MHQFVVGQRVRLDRHVLTNAVNGDYEIMRLVPDAGDGPQYRIKSPYENHERAALERNLTPSA